MAFLVCWASLFQYALHIHEYLWLNRGINPHHITIRSTIGNVCEKSKTFIDLPYGTTKSYSFK